MMTNPEINRGNMAEDDKKFEEQIKKWLLLVDKPVGLKEDTKPKQESKDE